MDRYRDLSCYLICELAEMWREMGLDVLFVYGTDEFVPANVAILHIDLSVVPQEYLQFARGYRVCLNGTVADIRKSTISTLTVGRDDSYDGPVIVKSNLNNAANPERLLAYSKALRKDRLLYRRVLRRLGLHRSVPFAARTALDYQLFDSLRDVPKRYFHGSDYVVEKFLPERVGDMYYLRLYQFLGTREIATRIGSRHPIVCAATMVSSERIDPHPDIVARRHQLNFDYGKFDYVMHDGTAILLDTNKTVGGRALEQTPVRVAGRRHRAEGILAYLDSAPRYGVTPA
jgi:hypothetical protein